MPNVTVSIDPGLRHLGLATFCDETLTYAGLIKNPETTARGPKAWVAMAEVVAREVDDRVLMTHDFASEVPQVYARGPGDPADLLELAGVVGAVAAVIGAGRATGYLPRVWKGQVPKAVMCRRIEDRLSDDEKDAVEKCPASLRHNVLDAIGIGLYHLGRLGKVP